MTDVFIKRGDDTQTQRRETHREGHVKTESEIGVTLPQTRGHQEPSEAGRGKEGPSLRAFGGSC